jgi:hypothetical protein
VDLAIATFLSDSLPGIESECAVYQCDALVNGSQDNLDERLAISNKHQ